jgi:hypothetical protein
MRWQSTPPVAALPASPGQAAQPKQAEQLPPISLPVMCANPQPDPPAAATQPHPTPAAATQPDLASATTQPDPQSSLAASTAAVADFQDTQPGCQDARETAPCSPSRPACAPSHPPSCATTLQTCVGVGHGLGSQAWAITASAAGSPCMPYASAPANRHDCAQKGQFSSLPLLQATVSRLATGTGPPGCCTGCNACLQRLCSAHR